MVDSYDRSFVQTIRVTVDPGDVPVVDSSGYTRTVGEGREKEESWE